MRYKASDKKQTHEKILQAAGRLFREKGYSGVGVDAIMAEAGLTAGGFYAHFDSKEALFSEVIKYILTNSPLSSSLENKDNTEWLISLIKIYLSRWHKDNANQGCPLPLLTPDVTRSSNKTRNSYEQCLETFFLEIAQRMSKDPLQAKEQAIALTAQLVGGLMLARAISNEELSNQVLKACQKAALQICESPIKETK